MAIYSKGGARQREDLRNGLLFASPWLMGLAIFILYPILASLYYSFCSYDAIRPPHWVGLRNYQQMLFDDPLFWKSLWNTLYMVVVGLPLGLAASLVVALLLNQK